MNKFFEGRIVKIDEYSCWLWKGSKNTWGYGRVRVPFSNERGVHRISWLLHNGPIPKGLNVLHKCDVPSCVNPSHLFLGTFADNNADKKAKGREFHPKGEMCGMAKLTMPAVRNLRSRKETFACITEWAKEFGVSRRAIRLCWDGDTWS